MKTYRLLIEGRDATGQFLVTQIVGAESLDGAKAVASTYAGRKGWEILGFQEVEVLDDAGESADRGVKSETGRTYFDPSAS